MLIIIKNTEDGEPMILTMSKMSFLEQLAAGDWGKDFGFFDRLPDDADPTTWDPTKFLVIEGEIRVPRPVNVITKWQL